MLSIGELHFKFGKSADSTPTTIPISPITVFVGPNNSGKSLVLREIQSYCGSGKQSAGNNKIIQAVGITPYSRQEAEAIFDKYKIETDNVLPPGASIFGRRRHQAVKTTREQLVNALVSSDPDLRCRMYLAHATLMLGGANRIALVNQQQVGDLRNGHPTTSFQVLFKDKEVRKEVRRVLHEAFGQYLIVDPSDVGHLRLAFANRLPISDVEEQGLNEAALNFYREATPIDATSDGVKAFTGILAEIVAGDPLVLIIDEPEAFLHPPLAFQLANEVSRLATKSDKNVFVSTHSANFVMGCIQSGAPVNIIRLTYRNSVATSRVLNNEDIFRLMRNPLLRSSGVLNALFYEFVVVTESDTDRAFYQEANERLIRFDPQRGIPNCLFLNAQNKQTVKTIIRPLRELGIPAAAIVDVDIIKDGGSEWSSFLKEGGFIPDIDCQALATSRKAVLDKFTATGKNMKKDGGIDLLSTTDKEAANNLFDMLAKYGLFALRRGELESWLPQLGATGKGTNWLIDIFEKMGEDPEAAGYVKPGTDDVWEFIADMKRWFENPNRNGIPS